MHFFGGILSNLPKGSALRPTNLYHLLGCIPSTESYEMPAALEALAQALVQSGKLRINAETERNFVPLSSRAGDATLTARELTDPALRPATVAKLQRYIAPAEGQTGWDALWDRLMRDLKKAGGVAPLKEIRIARVLVQSAHPAVIQCLLASGTEVFVSYSHTVGDLMPVHQWDTHGTASGLQATDSASTAVYVSAGGDPFFEGEHKHYLTDGFPALARMVVIAGQELGHFADLKRVRGHVVGRHSTDANHRQLRANPIARDGRLADMHRVDHLRHAYARAGLPRLQRAEERVAFYHKRRRYSLRWAFAHGWRVACWGMFVLRCQRRRIRLPLAVYPAHARGARTALFLSDMAFNLAPDADVYRNPDPLVEEAIAVIEAVARVPQQVHKWGHRAVSLAWPNLHAFYHQVVIPGVCENVTNPLPPQTLPLPHRLWARLRRRFGETPGYFP